MSTHGRTRHRRRPAVSVAPPSVRARRDPSRATARRAADRSPILIITLLVGAVGIVLVRRSAPAPGRWRRRRHGRGRAVHAVIADPRHARRRPDARQGRRAGHARGVDRLPVPGLRPVRADRRAGARQQVRDARDAPDRPPRRGLPGREELSRLRRIGRAGRRRPVRRRPGPLLAVPGLDVRQPDRRERGRLRGGPAQGDRHRGRARRRRLADLRRGRRSAEGRPSRDRARPSPTGSTRRRP